MAVKRTTADEKLAKLVAFFKSRPEFFSMKELERLIPKECGLPALLFPDILKAAVDEGLVFSEKCGITNLYWSFPKQAHHANHCEIEKLLLAINNLKEEKRIKEARVAELSLLHEDSADRRALLEEYNILQEKTKRLEEYHQRRESCSPEAFKAMQEQLRQTVQQANEITDNIFTLQSFVCRKYEMEKRDFNHFFNIPDSLDYLDCDF